MSESVSHPRPERLEAYVEGSLSDGDRAVVDSHLLTCPRCQTAVDEWQALFAALAEAPRPAPSAGFVDRVMAGVHVRQPLAARIMALVARLIPKTTAAWAAVTALLALPILAVGGAAAWLLSKPWITLQGLWLFVTTRAARTLTALAGSTADALLATGVGAWADGSLRAMAQGWDASQLGLGLALFAVAISISVLILYRYLIRTPTQDSNHVSYCF